MTRLAKNLIFAALMIGAFGFADLSSASSENFHSAEIYIQEPEVVQLSESKPPPSQSNNKFWDKFRDSVMNDDNNNGGQQKQNDNRPKPSHNKAM